MESHKIFSFDKVTIFFIHTDYHGYVHPYNYFEWMSYVREAFLSKVLSSVSEGQIAPLSMVTVNVDYNYLADARFGDEIEAVIFTENVRRISFDVVYEFYLKYTIIFKNKEGLLEIF